MDAREGAAVSLPERLWLVIQPSGERHFLVKEPLEGIAVWCAGLDATVVEYRLATVMHTPPPKKKAKAKA